MGRQGLTAAGRSPATGDRRPGRPVRRRAGRSRRRRRRRSRCGPAARAVRPPASRSATVPSEPKAMTSSVPPDDQAGHAADRVAARRSGRAWTFMLSTTRSNAPSHPRVQRQQVGDVVGDDAVGEPRPGLLDRRPRDVEGRSSGSRATRGIPESGRTPPRRRWSVPRWAGLRVHPLDQQRVGGRPVPGDDRRAGSGRAVQVVEPGGRLTGPSRGQLVGRLVGIGGQRHGPILPRRAVARAAYPRMGGWLELRCSGTAHGSARSSARSAGWPSSCSTRGRWATSGSTVAIVIGVIWFLWVLRAVLRVPEDPDAYRPDARQMQAFWIVVVLEVLLIIGGTQLAIRVLDLPSASVPWVATVLGGALAGVPPGLPAGGVPLAGLVHPHRRPRRPDGRLTGVGGSEATAIASGLVVGVVMLGAVGIDARRRRRDLLIRRARQRPPGPST